MIDHEQAAVTVVLWETANPFQISWRSESRARNLPETLLPTKTHHSAWHQQSGGRAGNTGQLTDNVIIQNSLQGIARSGKSNTATAVQPVKQSQNFSIYGYGGGTDAEKQSCSCSWRQQVYRGLIQQQLLGEGPGPGLTRFSELYHAPLHEITPDSIKRRGQQSPGDANMSASK
jgi:hypothetical protein